MGNHQSIGGVTPFLKIHEGSWADVFKAYDASLERYVLLKVLNEKVRNDEALTHQFELEARLMAKIQHPNVVSILSYGTDAQQVYLTTEFVEGSSLRELITAAGKIPPLIALQILQEITQGLQAAHQENIFHRDLKPANVLVSAKGHIKLADFGMATLKQDNQSAASDQSDEPVQNDERAAVMGTLAYLAPEHVFDAAPSIQSDLFSLGATLYEMLAGRPAFRGNDTREFFDSILHYDPIPLLRSDNLLPASMIILCQKLLNKAPKDRPQTTDVLLEEIHHIKKQYAAFRGQEHLQAYIEAPEEYASARLKSADTPATQSFPQRLNKESNEDRPAAQYQKSVATQSIKKRSPYTFLWAAIAVIVMGASVYFLQESPVQTKQDLQPSIAQNTEDVVPSSIEQPQQKQPGAASGTTLPVPTEMGEVAFPPVEASSDNIAQPAASQTGNTDEAAKPILTTEAEDIPAIVLADTSATRSRIQLPAPSQLPPASSETIPGSLDILCTPWCEVQLNGTQMGQAPPALITSLAPGTYQLRLTNPHYPAFKQEVNITPGAVDSVRLSFKDFVATIDFEVIPWAEIIIDSVSYGTVPPMQTILLAPGEHALTLKNSELGTWHTTFIVAAGEKRRQPYNLRTLLKN
ncbi:MAG: protein kinase [Rhodothermales bacterium]